jgi:hypothetical protein
LSREFAANPIGVFFDPDNACEAHKPGKGYEELHRAIMAGRFVSSVPAPLLGLPAEKLPVMDTALLAMPQSLLTRPNNK